MFQIRLLSCSLFDFETLLRIHRETTGQDIPYKTPTSTDPTELLKLFSEHLHNVRFCTKLTDLVAFTFLVHSDSQSVRSVDDWSRTANYLVAGPRSSYIIMSGTLTQWYDTMLLMNASTSPVRIPFGNRLYDILISNPVVATVFSRLNVTKYTEGIVLS
mgnify:CR=1 FL=1